MTPSKFPLAPNATIGILGTGQLGRMLSQAAAKLGFRSHIFGPEAASPAHDSSAFQTVAQFDDNAALKKFAEATDVVTFEFENVPSQTIDYLTSIGCSIAPNVNALSTSQDRLVEKKFLQKLGAQTAPYFAVNDLVSLEQGLNKIGRPSILKTRRLGYDGKGQTVIKGPENNLETTWDDANKKAWEEIGAHPSILEGYINFTKEISIIGARSIDGTIALFDPAQNEHRDGILHQSIVPAQISERTVGTAREIATDLLVNLDYVGVLGIEFFVLENGDLIVNEFAPRVHNSGHWTSDACAISQFEQHIRAIVGWPLGSPERHSNATMENIIGETALDWPNFEQSDAISVHLYGKRKALAGRKMGHWTKLSPKSE